MLVSKASTQKDVQDLPGVNDVSLISSLLTYPYWLSLASVLTHSDNCIHSPLGLGSPATGLASNRPCVI